MLRTAVAQAPGRVNLIGEHTDYNDGLCLPVAIPYTTTARATRRDDDEVHLVSAQQPEDPWHGTVSTSGPGQATGWAAYAAGVLWALGEAGHEVPGLDIEIDSTVPLGAGLSSSAALEAAVAVAAVALAGRELDEALRIELVGICCRAEAEVAGAPTGGLDQTTALLTRDGCALLVDFADHSTRPLLFPVEDDGLTLLIIDTRVSHALVDGGYGSRRSECEEAAALLGLRSLRSADAAGLDRLVDERLRRRARHVVTENARVTAAVEAVREHDWAGLGALFDASHRSLRDDFEVSCPELDVAVSAARVAGALGARMTGGGFGGSAIALVPTPRAETVRRAVDAAFAGDGFGAPGHLVASPSAPASVLGQRPLRSTRRRSAPLGTPR